MILRKKMIKNRLLIINNNFKAEDQQKVEEADLTEGNQQQKIKGKMLAQMKKFRKQATILKKI